MLNRSLMSTHSNTNTQDAGTSIRYASFTHIKRNSQIKTSIGIVHFYIYLFMIIIGLINIYQLPVQVVQVHFQWIQNDGYSKRKNVFTSSTCDGISWLR